MWLFFNMAEEDAHNDVMFDFTFLLFLDEDEAGTVEESPEVYPTAHLDISMEPSQIRI